MQKGFHRNPMSVAAKGAALKNRSVRTVYLFIRSETGCIALRSLETSQSIGYIFPQINMNLIKSYCLTSLCTSFRAPAFIFMK
jgi:hypothetical protein